MILSKKNIEAFRLFLIARGAEMLTQTNEFEILRFRANQKVGVLYCGKRGHSLVGEACAAHRAFESNGSWSAGSKKTSRATIEIRTLLERDGYLCFYCDTMMFDDEISREHLLPKVHGGSNHIGNMVLAHKKCNEIAGHKSLIEKIKLREMNLKVKL